MLEGIRQWPYPSLVWRYCSPNSSSLSNSSGLFVILDLVQNLKRSELTILGEYGEGILALPREKWVNRGRRIGQNGVREKPSGFHDFLLMEWGIWPTGEKRKVLFPGPGKRGYSLGIFQNSSWETPIWRRMLRKVPPGNFLPGHVKDDDFSRGMFEFTMGTPLGNESKTGMVRYSFNFPGGR